MCGIAGIILKPSGQLPITEKLVAMSQALSHRGPDGEGFMIASDIQTVPFFNKLKQDYTKKELPYIPRQPISAFQHNALLAFAHRRLSILDLSESGHQPMCDRNAKTWITFNGEIYNYVELKEELQKLGHVFISQSDTEVILAAYEQWGTECVKKFNGMWAFCIYDREKNICFASRDRFGVKPFYYLNQHDHFAFASEQKAFVRSGLFKARPREEAIGNYLLNGSMEYSEKNFFDDVYELFPGYNLIYDLRAHKLSISSYYHLSESVSSENDSLSEEELIEKIRLAFENSVKLRLRSDVEVGTCLSGGIDSSALAVVMASLINKPVHCFTSVFRNEKFNEERFADDVVKKIDAKHFKIEAGLSSFQKEADDLIFSQDVPIWSTSTYAQYKVMELAKQQHIKVVLDGQGADEIFGGYHHHFIAKWNNLMAAGDFAGAYKEMNESKKTISSPFTFFLKEKIKARYQFQKNHLKPFFNKSFVEKSDSENPLRYFNDVNLQLTDDIYHSRLKAFLKCEDRCGMWHSVESRTPFSDDIDLINLLFSFHGNKKIKHGISKYLLREAVKTKLPESVYSRYDKVGFETPMKDWMLRLRSQMIVDIKSADLPFLQKNAVEKLRPENSSERQLLFKLFVLSRWQKLFSV